MRETTIVVDGSGYCNRGNHEECGSGRLEVEFMHKVFVCSCDCHEMARQKRKEKQYVH